jgi:hypothetical protein
MLIINYSKEIENDIRRFHNQDFPFPDFSDPTFIEKKVLVDKGKIIGCGLVKLTSEFILIMDESSPLRSRVIGISEIQKNLICALLRRGIRDVHIFPDDEKIIKYAEHLGFEICNSKPALSLRFGY